MKEINPTQLDDINEDNTVSFINIAESRNSILEEGAINNIKSTIVNMEWVNDKLSKAQDLLDSGKISQKEFEILRENILSKGDDIVLNSNSSQSNNHKKIFDADTQIENKIPNISANYYFLFILAIVLFFVLTNLNNKTQENPAEIKAPDTTISTSVTNNVETSSTTCSICGRNFSGNGYEEISEGVWQLCDNDHQSYICSINCGRKHDMEINRVMDKYNVNTNSSRNDGRVYDSEACSLCKGTGIETGRNIATGETEARVCPMCGGKGVVGY